MHDKENYIYKYVIQNVLDMYVLVVRSVYVGVFACVGVTRKLAKYYKGDNQKLACSSAKTEVHEVQRSGIVAYISALSQVWVCEKKKERESERERECVCESVCIS